MTPIPDSTEEIPMPAVGGAHPHLREIADKIPGNLHLHKISSNNPKVMDAFPPDDRAAADLRDLDLNNVNAPVQRLLGVSWDLTADAFTFTVKVDNKPFTKHGVLSIINSLYDPLGIAAPVLIQGKCLLRGMTEQLKERQLEE